MVKSFVLVVSMTYILYCMGRLLKGHESSIHKFGVEWMSAEFGFSRDIQVPIGRRIRGRPRKRWIEDVEEDIQRMGIRGWRKLCKGRMEWKRITEKAKTHSGL